MLDVGIIGCGYWGPNLVRNFSEIDGCRVRFVSDLKKENLQRITKKHTGIKKFSDYREALDKAPVDAVVIVTNLAAHYEVAKYVLKAGKDALIEKPLAPSAKRAAELAAAAKSGRRIFMTGHTFLFNKAVIEIKKYLDSGSLGRLHYINAVRTNLGPIRDDTNALWDLATHDISVFLYMTGRMPLSVSAVGGCYVRKGRQDVVDVTLFFPGGVICGVHASWLEPRKVRNMTVIGDRKMVVFDDINAMEPVRIYDKGVIKEKKYDTFGEFQLILRDGDVRIPKIKLSEPLKEECIHFTDCVKSRKKPVSDAEFGVKVVKVLEAAEKSMRKNGASIEVK